MKTPGEYTFNEINSQPRVWAETLAALSGRQPALRQAWAGLSPRQVIFTGCGSTYYLAQTAAALLQELAGVPARGIPASDLLLFTPTCLVDPAQTLLVTVSRSGTTSETIAAMRKFRQAGGRAVWSITCDPDTPLAREADLLLPAETAQEQSMAQTRSFASMLILAQGLAATVAGEDTTPLAALPELGRGLFEQAAPLAEELAQRAGLVQFFFLGSGPHYGLACEGMMKMKEMSLTSSEAYHFLEFRHGPKSMVSEDSLVAGLLSAGAYTHEQRVLAEMTHLGATTLALNPTPADSGAIAQLSLAPALPAWARPVLYLPPLQLLAYYRAIGKGLDPDQPRNLAAVVYLEDLT